MSLPIETFSSRYAVRRLTAADLADMLALCRGNPLYYRYMKTEPTLANLAETLTALPPGTTEEQKNICGYYQGERLLAILDLIEGYPDAETAFLGWLIVDREAQGAGLGSALTAELFAALRPAFRRVRLGYVKGNPQSEHFWRKNDFLPTGEERAGEDYTVVVMQRDL